MNNLLRRGILQNNVRKYLSRSYAIQSATTEEQKTTLDKVSFDEIIQRRQAEATRSIVVQVSSEKSFNELYNYCHAFGNIVNAQHYCMNYDDEHHYILMEYATKNEAIAAMESSAYNDELTGVPVRSPFLWFRANGKRALKSHENLEQVPPLNAINALRIHDNTHVNAKLQVAQNIEEQIKLLHELTKLNDLGVRLRFLAALQVQQSLIGMFPEANAQPFGSSVNGFGKMGCDLDLILRFDKEMPTETMHKKRHNSRLVFHMKENLSNGRSQTQRQMESIGDMLQLFLPGVCHVRRILQARVPILKYHHEHMNLEVDLSMSNLSGFYMSELLYMFGELDDRVRPLTFCIRRWAQACGLTNPSPGRWITNFSLTCLVMYFLQQLKQPILPTVNALCKIAAPADQRMTEDGINCSFGRDLQRLDFRKQNTSQMSELMLQFFEFYSQFDFSNRAISLNEGRTIAKPDHSALYIVNPLENHLNVSKNVSLEECERLRCEVRNAAWVLESEVENPVIEQNEKGETHWGLLNLFKTSEKAILRPNMLFKPRMVEVSDLFEKATADMTESNAQIDFKSMAVKQQVQQIKTQARMDFKRMRGNSITASTASTTNADINTTTTKKARRSR